MTFHDFMLLLIRETTLYFSPTTVATEWVLAAIAILIIATLPLMPRRWLRAVHDGFKAIAGRKRTAIVISGLLPVVLRLSLLGIIPVPDPSIHDEFSHLLLADTLAHGRLTNPTPPMWQHFESIHIIQKPTYNSMYPPGVASFLALGQVVFDEPWAGVVIASGLMFAAMCWALQGWLPPAWAFFGTLVAILKFGVLSIWMNSYLTGAVAGLGGTLLIGALPRLRSARLPVSAGILFGTGAVILMNTRPFEGAVLTLSAAVFLVPSLFKQWRHGKAVLSRLVLPAAVVLSAGIIFTGYYCWRVTGSPLRMPYQVNRDTYGWPENLAFLAPKKLTLQHQVMQDMYEREVHNHAAYTTWTTAVASVDARVFENWTFFIGPLLTIPLLFVPWVVRNRRTRPLIVFIAVIAVLNLFQLVLYPYHLGPVVMIIFAIVAQAIRYLYVTLSRFRRRTAWNVALVLPVCVILIAALKQVAPEWGLPLAYWENGTETHRDARASIEQWLEARSGKELVLVRYAPGHNPNQEWVYNGADLDGGKVVWARAMDPESDAELVRYYSDREAWIVDADVFPQRVVKYPGPPLSVEDSEEK